jgi:hypothetical protein
VKARRQIVLFGPPFCGKKTLLENVAQAEGTRLERVTRACGSDALPHVFLTASLTNSPIDLVTLTGTPWNIDVWYPSIASASAIALMLDSQALGEAADREHLLALARAPSCPRIGCVVWTKEDLVTKHGLGRAKVSFSEVASGMWRDASGELRNGTTIGEWPTFATRFDNKQSMLAPLGYLMSALTHAEEGKP